MSSIDFSKLKVGRSPKITKWLKDNCYRFEEVDMFDNTDIGYYKVYCDIYGDMFRFQMMLSQEFPNWHFDYCNKCSGVDYWHNYFHFGRVKNWNSLSDDVKYHIIDNGG